MKRTLLVLAALLVALPTMAATDLTITGAVADPAAVKPLDTNFKVSFTLKNLGNVGVSGAKVKVPVPTGATYVNSSSSNGTMACASYSGSVICSAISGAAPLAPSGGSVGLTVTMKAKTAGSYSIAIEADPDAQLAEDSEANNKATLNVSFSDLPRVSVISNNCPSPKAVNQHYIASFVLKNYGTLDVRYPGLKINVDGAGQKVAVTKADGGTLSGVTLGAYAASHSFTWIPSASPLAAGSAAQAVIYLKSPQPHVVKVTASIDTQAIQDSTPKDNSATCTVKIIQ